MLLSARYLITLIQLLPTSYLLRMNFLSSNLTKLFPICSSTWILFFTRARPKVIACERVEGVRCYGCQEVWWACLQNGPDKNQLHPLFPSSCTHTWLSRPIFFLNRVLSFFLSLSFAALEYSLVSDQTAHEADTVPFGLNQTADQLCNWWVVADRFGTEKETGKIIKPFLNLLNVAEALQRSWSKI